MTGPVIVRRRICWPEPDATCLEGGCIHCRFERLRSMVAIRAYAARAGLVHHRYGDEVVDAAEILAKGVEERFYNRVEYVTANGQHHNIWEDD